jgi:hypothetical protein
VDLSSGDAKLRGLQVVSMAPAHAVALVRSALGAQFIWQNAVWRITGSRQERGGTVW